jgi:ribosomal protein L32
MTSIEWAFEQIEGESDIQRDVLSNILEIKISVSNFLEIKRIAKEMHKQEIINTVLDVGSFMSREEAEQYYNENYGSKGSDDHISDISKMVKKGTLKKRMDKDAWFVVFQSNAYNENDMAYDLLKSQEIDIDMYDVYKDGDEVTFELVNKKWAKITPFLYPFENTSSQTEICISCDEQKETHKICMDCIGKMIKENQTEISDEEIEKGAENAWSDYEYEEGNLYSTTFKGGWKLAIKWYREQLKSKNNEL